MPPSPISASSGVSRSAQRPASLDVQPLTLKTVAKSAGTDSADAGQVVSTTPYGMYLRLMETDHSGNPWTMASVNGTQFGVEVG